LLDLTDALDISFQWVRGHVGHPFNERCDQLAGAAFREKDLPVDGGYLRP
jgi:ribonuclease HI